MTVHLRDMELTPENIIQAGRNAYRMTPDAGRPFELGVIVRLTAKALRLDHEDYYDLVRHLITDDEVSEDAYRWATSGSEPSDTRRSTVPEGSQGGSWNVSTTSGWSGRTTGRR